MKHQKNNLTYWLGVIAVGIFLGLAIQFVRAWAEPSGNPPGGNVGAPINTGNQPQTKQGAIYSGDRLGAPTLCIGTDCRSAWPSGTPTPAPTPTCPDCGGCGTIYTMVYSCPYGEYANAYCQAIMQCTPSGGVCVSGCSGWSGYYN